VLRIKFSAGRQFSASKSPTSCSCKPLCTSLKTDTLTNKITYLISIFFVATIIGCGTDKQNDTTLKNELDAQPVEGLHSDTLELTKASNSKLRDTIVLAESLTELDNPINDYLTDKLKPIRDNFNKINSIKEWTSIDKRKLENLPDNGVAEYYYLYGNLQKVIARYPLSNTSQITEYYFLNGQMSFAIEKSIIEADKSETEVAELITDKNYFINKKLVHKIHSQDCGAPFANDYLIEEQKRITDNFEHILVRLNK